MAKFKNIRKQLNELNGQTGPVLRISYRPQKANISKGLTSHSTIDKSDLYNDIVYNNRNWKITANTNSLAFRLPHPKGREDDRADFMGLLKKAIPGKTGNLIRGGGFTESEVQELKRDYEKAIKVFKGDTVVSQDHEIYVAADKPGGLNVKAGLLAMLKALDEFGMRNHISLSSRDGVLTQIQDAGQYNRLDEDYNGNIDDFEYEVGLAVDNKKMIKSVKKKGKRFEVRLSAYAGKEAMEEIANTSGAKLVSFKKSAPFVIGLFESVNEEVISEKIQYKGYPTKYAALHGQLGLKTLAQAKAVDHLIVAGGKKPDQIAKIFKNFGPSQFQDIVNLLNVSTKPKDLKDTEKKLKAGFHHENVEEAIDGRRKEFKEKIKKLAYEKMKKMMKAQKENWDISEGIENKERQLNYKLKELEYKMKLKDFMDSVVNSKLPKKNEYKHDKKKKMEEADTVSLKITDTSSTAFNKLSKIARDVGIEFSRQDNHLLAKGDAKKMEEFKAQMDVAMKESVQLQEGTWQIPDSYPKLVGLQKFLRKPHKAKTAKEVFAFHNEVDKFFGDDTFSDHLDAYYDLMPGGDVDPYDGKKQSPEEYKETIKRIEKYYKRNPQARIKKGSDLNFVLMKALTDWTGGQMKFKGNKIVQMPRDWYMNDNPEYKKSDAPIKATLNADVDVDDDEVKEVQFKRKRGNLKMKRQPSIQIESKKTFGDIKNELQERNLRISQLIRKYRDELKKAQRTGNLELSPEAEEDFMIWGMNNGEIATDDPDEFIDWLDTNLDDLVKGRIR